MKMTFGSEIEESRINDGTEMELVIMRASG